MADTSAWVDYLRRTGSPTNLRLRSLIEQDGDLVTTEPVLLEILVGTTSETRAGELRNLLGRHDLVPVEAEDWEEAAVIHRTCRRGGETVRSHVDCLIAAVAIRSGAEVLHRDHDFVVIARHTSLRVAS